MNALPRCFSIRGHGLLDGLSFLAPDLFTGITHAFALVRLGWIKPANISSHLADQLLVDALNVDLSLISDGYFNLFWNRKQDQV